MRHHQQRAFLTALALLCLAMTICSSPASAFIGHKYLGGFKGVNLTEPEGVAEDAAEGDLYIAERAAALVQKFDTAARESTSFAGKEPYIEGSLLTGTSTEPFG